MCEYCDTQVPTKGSWADCKAQPSKSLTLVKETQVNAPTSVCQIKAPYSKEQEATEHLLDRLYKSYEDKRIDLKKQFGLVDEDAPKTRKDLIERITQGKYQITPAGQAQDVLNEKMNGILPNIAEMLGTDYLLASWAIRWRDPSKAEDLEGFDAAIKRRDAAYDKATTIILVKSGDEAIKAVEDFELQSFWS